MVMKTPNHRLFEKSKEYALDYMQTVDQRNVYPTTESLRALNVFRESLPDAPTDGGKILDLLHQFGSPATVAQTVGQHWQTSRSQANVVLRGRMAERARDQNQRLFLGD